MQIHSLYKVFKQDIKSLCKILLEKEKIKIIMLWTQHNHRLHPQAFTKYHLNRDSQKLSRNFIWRRRS